MAILLPVRALLLVAGLCLSRLGANEALAADGAYCHDIPARTTVLNEGQDYLLRHGGPGKSRSSGRDLINYVPYSYEHEVLTKNISLEAINQYPLQTAVDLSAAATTAEALERSWHFESALMLYQRILHQYDLTSELTAGHVQAIESVARTELLMSSPSIFDRGPAEFSDPGQQHDSYGVGSRFFGYKFLQRKIASITELDVLTRAEALYSRALAMRRRLNNSGKFVVSDLLILGSIKDRLKKTAEAKSCYLEVARLDSTKLYDVANFTVARKDFSLARQKESFFVEQLDTYNDAASAAVLLAMYQSEHNSAKTQKLFRQVVTNSIFVPSAEVLPMLTHVEPADVEPLSRYVVSVWAPNARLDPDFVKVIDALNRRGLQRVTDTICRSVMDRPTLSNFDLLLLTEYQRDSGNQSLALSAYKLMLKPYGVDSHSEAAVITDLNSILTSMKSPSLKECKYKTALIATASKQLAFHKEQIRRRQCLEMAAKLSKTGFDLERTTHNAMAQKMYQNALEIMQLNLQKDDPEVASQMMDVARVCAAQKNYAESQSFYEKALSILRNNPRANGSLTRQALEGYGQLLNEMKQTAKADKIYDEARKLTLR